MESTWEDNCTIRQLWGLYYRHRQPGQSRDSHWALKLWTVRQTPQPMAINLRIKAPTGIGQLPISVYFASGRFPNLLPEGRMETAHQREKTDNCRNSFQLTREVSCSPSQLHVEYFFGSNGTKSTGLIVEWLEAIKVIPSH